MQTLRRPSFKNNYLLQIQLFLVDIQARSSNVNEVIRAVLNELFYFFYEKILHTPEAPKVQRHKKAKAQNNAPKTPKAPKAQ